MGHSTAVPARERQVVRGRTRTEGCIQAEYQSNLQNTGKWSSCSRISVRMRGETVKRMVYFPVDIFHRLIRESRKKGLSVSAYIRMVLLEKWEEEGRR